MSLDEKIDNCKFKNSKKIISQIYKSICIQLDISPAQHQC